MTDFSFGPVLGEGRISAQLNGRLLFFSSEGASGFRLWSSSGQPNDTLELVDWTAQVQAGLPRDLQRLGEFAYFSAWSEESGNGLYRTNGTSAGTRRVVNVDLLGGGTIGESVALEDVIVFTLDERAVYATDGTQAGTALLEDFTSSASADPNPRKLTRVGDRVAWIADTSPTGTPEGFWVTDGTPAGTRHVLLPGDPTFAVVDAVGSGGPFLELGDGPDLVAVASTDATGVELWRWSSDAEPPSLLPELRPGPSSSLPKIIYDSFGGFDPEAYWLAEIGGQLVFTGVSASAGTELYAYDLASLGAFGAEPFGVGCAASDPLRIDLEGAAFPGAALSITLDGAPPAAGALAFYSQGIAPADLGGCEIYLAAPKLLGVTLTDAAGAAAIDATLPASPALAGVQFSLQWLAAVPGGPLLGAFEASAGMELVPGS